jgi:cell division transport system permease protein
VSPAAETPATENPESQVGPAPKADPKKPAKRRVFPGKLPVKLPAVLPAGAIRGISLAARVTGNVVELVFRDALRNWARNFRSVMPAIGSMTLLLLIAGVASLVAVAARNILNDEARQASFVHLYLKQDASADAVDALQGRLKDDRRVASIRYISSGEAERQARQRPGLSELIDASGSNPFPANLEVHVRNLSDVSGLVAAVRDDPALDQANPSSYDPATYQQLQTGLKYAGFIVIGFLALLGLVSAVVTANAIRAAIIARWDDLTIMRLVGASRWMVRSPFVFEGALTGAVAGLIAGAVLIGVFAATQRLSLQTFTSLLPGVGWYAAFICGGAVLVVGAFLGSASSLLSVRRLRT